MKKYFIVELRHDDPTETNELIKKNTKFNYYVDEIETFSFNFINYDGHFSELYKNCYPEGTYVQSILMADSKKAAWEGVNSFNEGVKNNNKYLFNKYEL